MIHSQAVREARAGRHDQFERRDPAPAGGGEREPVEPPTSSSSAPVRAGRATAAYLATTGLDVAAAGEDRLPPREGLRRRPHPPRGPELITLGVRRPRRTAGSAQPRACASSAAAMRLSAAVAGPRELPAATAWSAPGQDFDEILARHARQARRPAARAHQRHRPGARRPHRPRRRRHRQAASTTTAARPATTVTYRAPLVVAADGISSRLSLVDRTGPSATTGRWASPCAPTTRARATTTTTSSRWLELWSTRRRRQAHPAARLRLDLRRRRRHHQRRPRHPQHLQGLQQGRLQGRAAALGRRHARGVELTRRVPMTGPIRGAALPMGFNRTAALRRRPAARRRRRRHGQPVQRRGHRLRHGVRRASPPSVIAQALRPPERRRPRAGARRPTRRVMKDALGGYFTLGRGFAR